MENMKDFFSRLFLNTDSGDSMMALILLGVTVLLSIFLGWLLRGGKVRRLKDQLDESEKKYKLLHAENAGLEDQLKQQSADVQEKTTRIETMEANMQSYEDNQFKLRNSLQAAQQQVEQMNRAQAVAGASSTEYEDKISAMENQTAGYETQLQENAETIQQLRAELQRHQHENKQVEAELERIMDHTTPVVTPSGATIQTAFSKIDGLEDRIRQMEKENQVLQNSVQEVKTESGEMVAKEDLKSLRARINILSEENKDLKKQVSGIKGTGISEMEHLQKVADLEYENERLRQRMANGSNGLATGAFVNPNVSVPVENEMEKPLLTEEELTDEVDRQQVELLKTQKAQFNVLGDRIDVEAVEPPPSYDKDDLTKIEGIGPFIEKKLNEISITSYQQLAAMNQSEIDEVTAAIQFFPGRIERDDWVGQAQKLK